MLITALMALVVAPAALAAPVNDNFAAAEALSGASDTATGTSIAATKEAGEPLHTGNVGGKSVWYRWTAPSSGTFLIDLSASSFDTMLGVYTGSAVNALTEVASDDDGGASVTSKVVFSATSGVEYQIAVDGYNMGSGAESGAIDLVLAEVLPPANDAFAAAEVLNGSNDLATGTNLGATKEAGEPEHAGDTGGASVWYSWEAPSNGWFTVDLLNSDFDTLLGVYTGGAVDALTEVASNDQAAGTNQSLVAFEATAGATYRIAVDGWSDFGSSSPSTGAVELELYPTVAPANDDFAGRETLNGFYDEVNNASTILAGAETGEPAHGGAPAANSVWYSFTAPAGRNVAYIGLVTDGRFDPRIGVYTGGGVDSLTEVAQSDDFGQISTDPSVVEVFIPITAGQQYAIAVDGGQGLLAFNFGSYQGAANDAFAAAEALSGTAASTSGDTSYASAQANEPAHAGYAAYSSLWYSWTAPSNGATTLTTAGSASDTRLAVYTGSSLAGLTQVAANDNVSSSNDSSVVTFQATAGTVYRIAVDIGTGLINSPFGPYNLGLTHVAAGAPDDGGGGDGGGGGEVVDQVAPETTITKAPRKVATTRAKAKVKVAFAANEADATFQCKVDRKPFADCGSPLKAKLKLGKHVIEVRAVDRAGNVDGSPARANIKVIRGSARPVAKATRFEMPAFAH